MMKTVITGVCPVLCSQRGEYINGECQCNPGWKGKECSLRHDECEVPDCNGHGHCVNGKCACVLGYKGKFCEQGKALSFPYYAITNCCSNTMFVLTQLIVRIRLVLAMVTASKEPAFAKRVGRVLIVVRWIKTLFSVFPIVPDMEPLI